MAKQPEIVNAREILSQWYGPDSTVCDTVEILSDESAVAKFTVGKNLCGLHVYPPMFRQLRMNTDGTMIFTTKTSTEDAWQHFNESIGFNVIPGHNIIGLLAEAAGKVYNPGTEVSLYTTSFDSVRFRQPVFPGQDICMKGDFRTDENGVCGAFTMCDQQRPFVKNFRIEAGDSLDNTIKNRRLAQHWITEFNAQGLGILGLKDAPKGVVPVLMEVGESTFTKMPITVDNTLRSELEITFADKRALMGNARTFIEGELIAEQEGILLGFSTIEDIRQKMEQTKMKGN